MQLEPVPPVHSSPAASEQPGCHVARLAVMAWGIVLVIVCVRAFLSPDRHTVYPIFSNAARSWVAARELYVPHTGLDDYRYSPLATCLLAPLAFLPDRLGGVLWRLLNAGIFLGALFCWTRDALPRRLTRAQRATLFLLILPLAAGNLNNGQSNPLLLGLLLAAVTAAARRRWVIAAGCVVLAAGFKVYPLALGLLLVLVLPRRFTAALLISIPVALGLPFLLQEPGYVAQQWGEWARHVTVEDRHSRPLEFWYRDFYLLWTVWIGPLGKPIYTGIQLAVTASLAALCWARNRWPWPVERDVSGQTVPTFVLAVACCWMTAFGPATETSTYLLLTPSLAWALLETWQRGGSWALRVITLTSYGVFIVGQILAWLPGLSRPFQTLGAYPLAGLLLLAAVTWSEVFRLPWSARRQPWRPVFHC